MKRVCSKKAALIISFVLFGFVLFSPNNGFAYTVAVNPDHNQLGNGVNFQPLAGSNIFTSIYGAETVTGSHKPNYSQMTFEYEYTRQAAIYIPSGKEPMIDTVASAGLEITSNPANQTNYQYKRGGYASGQIINYGLYVQDLNVPWGTPVKLKIDYRSATDIEGAGGANASFILRRTWGGSYIQGAVEVNLHEFISPAYRYSGVLQPYSAGFDATGYILDCSSGSCVTSNFTPSKSGNVVFYAKAGELLLLSTYASVSAVPQFDSMAGTAVAYAQGRAIIDPFISVSEDDSNYGSIKLMVETTGSEYTRGNWENYINFGPPVPIPATIWLLGAGLLGLVGIRRRFSK